MTRRESQEQRGKKITLASTIARCRWPQHGEETGTRNLVQTALPPPVSTQIIYQNRHRLLLPPATRAALARI